MNRDMISPKRIGVVALFALIVMVGFASFGSLVETNDAGFMQVKQAAVTGELTCRMEPGMYGQLFGSITTYKEAETFYFTADTETGEDRNQSLPARFNDGAKAMVSGSLRVLLPRDCDSLLKLHRKFHSMDGVMNKLTLPAVRKALFSTGPHMSAGESYAERRGEFASLAEDQLKFGVIMTDKHERTVTDPITGQDKNVLVLTKRSCDNGEDCIHGFARDRSAFSEFGVDITNFVIDGIDYPQAVLGQIEAQRKARMNIITQQAQAKEAEARASKAAAEARAQVAETRAKEEVQKTQKVVRAEADKAEAILLAEKKRDEAKLDAEAALLEKKANIARGEGEAARRQLVMKADGALDKKLNAWVKAQEAYASAFASAQPGALVPTVVMGAGAKGQSSSASQWMDLMMTKAAKDLALDMAPTKK